MYSLGSTEIVLDRLWVQFEWQYIWARCYYVFTCTRYNKDDNRQLVSGAGTFRKDFYLAEKPASC